MQTLQPVRGARSTEPLTGGHSWAQASRWRRETGRSQWLAVARSSRRPRSSGREAQQLQVIHRTHRGWASINNVWPCGPGSCRSAPPASESGAGLPRSLIAAHPGEARERGESTRWVEGLRSSFLSAIFYAIVPRLLGCELWCVWHKGIRYRRPPPHTTSGLGGVQDLGGLVRHCKELLKGPFFTSSAALSLDPTSLSSHLCSGNRLVLCSCLPLRRRCSLLRCGSFFGLQVSRPPLTHPSRIFRAALAGGRCVRPDGCMLAGDAHFRCRLCARNYEALRCMHLLASCAEPSDVVTCTDARSGGHCFSFTACALLSSCRRRRASAAHPSRSCGPLASCYACACDLSVRQTY